MKKPKHRHPLYNAWRNMLTRCYHPSYHGYHYYVERGIEVCEEWRNDFWAFAEHVGDKPTPKHTLDRIDNNLGYVPGNVRWATMTEQRRNSRMACFVVGGKTLEEASAESGLHPLTIYTRLKSGMTVEEALTKPKRSMCPRNTLIPKGGIAICLKAGIPVRTVSARMKRGMTFDEAIARSV